VHCGCAGGELGSYSIYYRDKPEDDGLHYHAIAKGGMVFGPDHGSPEPEPEVHTHQDNWQDKHPAIRI